MSDKQFTDLEKRQSTFIQTLIDGMSGSVVLLGLIAEQGPEVKVFTAEDVVALLTAILKDANESIAAPAVEPEAK